MPSVIVTRDVEMCLRVAKQEAHGRMLCITQPLLWDYYYYNLITKFKALLYEKFYADVMFDVKFTRTSQFNTVVVTSKHPKEGLVRFKMSI